MLSTDGKVETLRLARAEGKVLASPATLQRLRLNELPKKDVLPTARAAGLLAAKRTPDLIPDCHPLPLDKVELSFELLEDGVRIQAEALAVARTGLEMEALCAVSVAALTVYDMLKPVDDHLEITGLRLLEKRGGKSDFPPELKPGFRAAVVVTSDRCAKGSATDKTGPLIVETLKGLGVADVAYHLLPDDKGQIQALMLALCDEDKRDLVLSTGGTGLSPRDVTVEAVQGVLERELPGVMEAARHFGQRRTPYAMLSRGVAGQRGRTLIVTLPGSSGGVKDSLAALYPYLLHAHRILGGGNHEPAHAGGAAKG